MGIFGATKEEQLKLLRNVEYTAPSGFFDDTAEGKPGPMPLLEEEDGIERMAVLRSAFAGLVAQHVFLCLCAIVGIQLHQMNITLPDYVNPTTMAVAILAYFGMYYYATRGPNNLCFFVLFTICTGSFMAVSVATGKHTVANLMFQFTLGWVLMLLYSLPSFCCDAGIFDIKHSGVLGYSAMLLVACGTGGVAAMHISGGHEGQKKELDHEALVNAMMPVACGMVYMMGALWSVRRCLGYFYKDQWMAVMIYPWAYPLDWAWRFSQFLSRNYLYPLPGPL